MNQPPSRFAPTRRSMEAAALLGMILDRPCAASDRAHPHDGLASQLLDFRAPLSIVVGPSGAGKTTLLRRIALLARRGCDRIITINLDDAREHPLAHRPLVDLFQGSVENAMRSLARAGLAEGACFVRRPRELSAGQLFRLRLALAMVKLERPTRLGGRVLIIDEFAALLDSDTAWGVAVLLKKFVNQCPGLRVFLATPREELIEALMPARIVEIGVTHAARLILPRPLPARGVDEVIRNPFTSRAKLELKRAAADAPSALEDSRHGGQARTSPAGSGGGGSNTAQGLLGFRISPGERAEAGRPFVGSAWPFGAQDGKTGVFSRPAPRTAGSGNTRAPRCGEEARASRETRFCISQGTMHGYDALAPLHYRAGAPATVVRVLVARAVESEKRRAKSVKQADAPQIQPPVYALCSSLYAVVGVLLVSMPTLNGSWRRHAWPGIFNTGDKREDARRLNDHGTGVRCISRVIIDPRFRGVGLASRLVRAYLDDPLTGRTEAVAAMGRASSFFENAGMTRYEVPASAGDARLMDLFGQFGIGGWELCTPTRTYAKALRRIGAGLLGRELMMWSRSSRASLCASRGSDGVRSVFGLACRRVASRPVAFAASSGGSFTTEARRHGEGKEIGGV